MPVLAAVLETAAEVGAARGDIPLRALWLLLFFLTLTGVASLLLQKLRFSYTIGLVLLGLLCSWLGNVNHLPLLPEAHLTENMVLYIFLPALIFEAALSLDVELLRRNLVPILLLAAPGVVFATLVTGALVHWATPLGWGAAMIFGALISTTDPVAVIAMFKEVRAPERLTMLLDGESLFNDATAIVIFGIVVGLVSTDADPTAATLLWAALEFVWVFVGGFAVGMAVGWLGCQFIHCGRGQELSLRRTLRMLFSTCTAYAAFLLAQGWLEVSGVMAAVGAGIVVAHWVKTRESERTLRQLREFWNIAAFLGNSLIFLFLGLTERYLFGQHHLAGRFLSLLLAVLAVFVVRAVMVNVFVPLSNILPRQERIGGDYRAVMVWGGIRGALPVGLAISLKPEHFGAVGIEAAESQRALIVLFTVAVVVFTLIVQGLTIRPLLRRFRLTARGWSARYKAVK